MASCIPFNTFDKKEMQAKFYLAGIKCREEVKCPELEKEIFKWFEVIVTVVSGLVTGGLGLIAGSLVGDYVTGRIEKNTSAALKKFDEYKLKIIGEFRKLEGDLRTHILVMVYHYCLGHGSKGYNTNTFVTKFNNHDFSVMELNTIYFLKSLQSSGAEINKLPLAEAFPSSQLDYHLDRVFGKKGRDWPDKTRLPLFDKIKKTHDFLMSKSFDDLIIEGDKVIEKNNNPLKKLFSGDGTGAPVSKAGLPILASLLFLFSKKG
jgi:hypothetical protein